MVKSLVSILTAFLLLVSAALIEWRYVETEFDAFAEELATLRVKVEEETANAEDAKALRISWDEKKSRLHAIIPHNDVSRIDDWMSETVGLIEEGNYSLALSKLEVLEKICHTVPDTYRPALENVL
ncbi:MAG: DUF4363 family protein [Candidatus Gallimonas sp.]